MSFITSVWHGTAFQYTFVINAIPFVLMRRLKDHFASEMPGYFLQTYEFYTGAMAYCFPWWQRRPLSSWWFVYNNINLRFIITIVISIRFLHHDRNVKSFHYDILYTIARKNRVSSNIDGYFSIYTINSNWMIYNSIMYLGNNNY